MRQIILTSKAPRLEAPGAINLPMDEAVWESGYSRIIGMPQHALLHRFWQHYYGASAEMVWKGADLSQLREEITAALPDCLGHPDVTKFLLRLATLCDQAHSEKGSLQVIAD